MMDTIIQSKAGTVFLILSIALFCMAAVWLFFKNFDIPRKLWSLTLLIYFEYLVFQAVFNWYFHIPVPRPLELLALIPAVGISYMYFLSLTASYRITSKLIVWHLAPYALFLKITFVLDFLYGWNPGLRSIRDYVRHLHHPMNYMVFLFTIYIIFYEAVIIYRLVTGYRSYLKQIQNGNAEQFGNKSLLALICVFCTLIIFNMFEITNDLPFFAPVYTIILPPYLFYFISFGMQPHRNQPEGVNPTTAIPVQNGDCNLSGAVDKTGILKKKILKYVEEQKPYLNQDLKIQDLANALSTNRSYISQTLNREFGTTFYAFINTYRVQHSVELMKEKPDLIVDYYANKSGFKSRSVYFAEFKKITGYTPYQFIMIVKSEDTE